MKDSTVLALSISILAIMLILDSIGILAV